MNNSEVKIEPRYLAGFFDGEGCVGLFKDRIYYRMAVTLTQSEGKATIKLFSALKKKFGGGINKYQEKREARRKNSRPGFHFALTKRAEIKKFLLFIKPFVFFKKPQVEVALSWLESRPKLKGGSGHSFPESVSKIDEKVRQKLKFLKKA